MPDLGFDVRAALLKSGKREFLECGFEKASLRSICAGAGVTTGAFYSNFRAKDDLFGAIYLVVMLAVVMLSGMIPICSSVRHTSRRMFSPLSSGAISI